MGPLLASSTDSPKGLTMDLSVTGPGDRSVRVSRISSGSSSQWSISRKGSAEETGMPEYNEMSHKANMYVYRLQAHTYTHVYKHAHHIMYVYTYVETNTYICTYICMYLCMYVC